MQSRLFPHPLLSVTLFVMWLLMVTKISLGNAALALVLATAIPKITATYWPESPKIRAPLQLIGYVFLLVWDIILANLQVARLILFVPNEQIKSAWVAIPIELKTPEAITMLAGSITMTPGTLTADMSSCGRVLLVHALHAPDPEALRDEIKSRYESRLKRIFDEC